MFPSKPARLRGDLLLLAVAAVSVLLSGRAATADVLRWAPGTAADQARPVTVYADHITTWTDGGHRFFVATGKVLINQGLVNLRFQEGVIWVNENRKQREGFYDLQIYAEGNVSAESGAKNLARKDKAHLELTTRAEISLKSADRKINEQSLREEPLCQRAFEQFQAVRTELPAMVTVASSPREPDGFVRQVGGQGPEQALPDQPGPGQAQPVPIAPWQVPQPPAPVQPQPVPVVPPGGKPRSEVLPTPKLMPGVPQSLDALSLGGSRPYIIRSRSTLQGIQMRTFPLPSGETAVVISSGVILTVFNADNHGGMLDVEADRAVFFKRGNPNQIMENLQSPSGKHDRQMEFYMAGNVEIRRRSFKEIYTLRADEVYYDVSRHVAVCSHADLEIADPKTYNPIHVQSDELLQVNADLFRSRFASVNASVLPWDPGLRISIHDATIEQRKTVRRTIFGLPVVNSATGEPVLAVQRYFTGNTAVVWADGLPVFYFPYVQGDAEHPLGPFQSGTIGYNHIFGFQFYTNWSLYDLVGLTALPGTKWRLDADLMTQRGPGLGQDFLFSGKNLFGVPSRFDGNVNFYSVFDQGPDVIGGNRGQSILVAPTPTHPFQPVETGTINHPEGRGRFFDKLNVQDLPYGFSLQAWLYLISDRNFMEQYFSKEFQNELNPETFVYLKQQQGNWAWTALVEPRLRDWVTETQSLPRLDGYVLGASLFDVATYNAHASAGYYILDPTNQPPWAVSPTDVYDPTARLDLMQKLSVPFAAGPVKLAPYGILDLTYYSRDGSGNDVGRVYEAGGLTAALPLSRLYPDVHSELFNLNGLYHKINLSANAYVAHSNVHYNRLPQLDRLNDDTSDQAIRDFFPWRQLYYPNLAADPRTLALFDPQLMAIRKLVLDKTDTLDDIEVLQLDLRQRWQTKRGLPGREHIIDWMTLDVSASIFPRADRDNFGSTFAFFQYNWLWNIGDRTSLESSGWIDPIANGPRIFNFGANLNRPDGTSFYLGYRQVDPLSSKSVLFSTNYQLSAKYLVTASTSYDFGIKNQVTTVMLTRTGTDLRISLGLSYNSILNTTGVVFQVLPNLFPLQTQSPGGLGFLGAGSGPGR